MMLVRSCSLELDSAILYIAAMSLNKQSLLLLVIIKGKLMVNRFVILVSSMGL